MKYLEDLNSKQREAVIQTTGPVLIVAGAGAGKTKTITYRIFHLIKNGVSPERILAITFTNKAAREMRERVEKLCMADPEVAKIYSSGIKPFINTFHALGVQIIKQNSAALGLPRFFSISDKADGKKIVKEALIAKNYDPKQFDPARILNTISGLKGKGITSTEYAEQVGTEYFAKIVSAIWIEYEAALAKEKALDLDDLLLVTMQLLKKNLKVREYYQNLWQYIHIDEYQDTNTVQYQIARLLSDSHKNMCVVGDADQNIYSWRGADISNILRFEKDFPNSKVVLLEENYRSTKTIIDSANQIIKKNKQRIEKNLFTSKGLGEKIGIFEGWSEIQEAYFVAHKTRQLIEKGISPDEIAVLYRANFQSRTLEEAFMGLAIPYSMIGTKFFERKEVKDVLCFVRAALNRDSWTEMSRIINVPARGIGEATLEKLRTGMMDKIAPATRRRVEVFYTLLDRIAEKAKTTSASETIKFVLKESGIEETLKHGSEEDTERFENLMELVSLATRYDGLNPLESIDIFLGDAALAAQEEAPGEKQASVKLMTVHSAKGLEFDYVFITGLEQGLFPHERMGSGGGGHQDEEERRLFYVAITRARKKVFLTYSQVRTIFGEQEIHTPSEFLSDIPSELTEREFLVAKQSIGNFDFGDESDTIIQI